ncbi:MAG: NACHT domain-containing protein [Candidatus Nitrosopolaris sp.]
MRRAQNSNLIPKDDDLIPNFILKFDITLEQKVDNDPDIQPFKKWYTVVEGTKNLRRHLQDSRLLIDKTNSIDQKSLKYYVENNAVLLTDLETWDKEEEDYKGKDREATDLIIDFLKEKGWYMVIGAPFGIGKTSLAIYVAYKIASKYLEEPDNEYNYIPIFVPLKDKLAVTDEDQNSLDDKLRSIIGKGEAKKRKILLICDGLDEYGEDVSKLRDILGKKRSEDLPNMKVIITTRLEAGLPQKLDISSYIRLLPFNEKQVTKFFEKYGLPDITFDILKSYNLTEEEIFKPLFCWMFAIMRNSKSFDIETVFKNFDSREKRSMSRTLIYQGFIHSIVRGKRQAQNKRISLDPISW